MNQFMFLSKLALAVHIRENTLSKGSFPRKKTEDLVNLALFPTQIVKNIIVKIGP